MCEVFVECLKEVCAGVGVLVPGVDEVFVEVECFCFGVWVCVCEFDGELAEGCFLFEGCSCRESMA